MNHSKFGHLLYQTLPDYYRQNDDGSLAQYLDICGELMDQFDDVITGMGIDFQPSATQDSNQIQDWTLSYTASLLGTRLMSPQTQGRNLELANSLRWNKRKGTLSCLEEITEAMMNQECIIQEGQHQIAHSVRVGSPLIPAEYYGEESDSFQTPSPQCRALHPGFPTTTPIIAHALQPVVTDRITPDTQRSLFGTQRLVWRVPKNHGVPTRPHAFFDTSPKTVDFRKATQGKGSSHPTRILLFIPPQEGFFSSQTQTLKMDSSWLEQGVHNDLLEIRRTVRPGLRDLVQIYRKGEIPLQLTGKILLKDCDLEMHDLLYKGHLVVQQGSALFQRCAIRSVTLTSTTGAETLQAQNSLLGSIQNLKGQTILEHCTVLNGLYSQILLASDCLFANQRFNANKPSSRLLPLEGYLRFCSLLPSLKNHRIFSRMQMEHQTILYQQPHFESFEWGERGLTVLKRGLSPDLESGAENLDVLGCYNHLHYSGNFQATLRKLKAFLPIGLEANLIEDPCLWLSDFQQMSQEV